MHKYVYVNIVNSTKSKMGVSYFEPLVERIKPKHGDKTNISHIKKQNKKKQNNNYCVRIVKIISKNCQAAACSY